MLEHQPDGVQASAAVTDVVSVVQGSSDGIKRLDDASEGLPGRGRAVRDAPRPVAPQPLGPDGLKGHALLVAQRAGVIDASHFGGCPLPSARLLGGGDGTGDGAHVWPAVGSSSVRRLTRQVWISAIPRLSLSGSPVLYLRRGGDDGLFAAFASHFDAVWSSATEPEHACPSSG